MSHKETKRKRYTSSSDSSSSFDSKFRNPKCRKSQGFRRSRSTTPPPYKKSKDYGRTSHEASESGGYLNNIDSSRHYASADKSKRRNSPSSSSSKHYTENPRRKQHYSAGVSGDHSTHCGSQEDFSFYDHRHELNRIFRCDSSLTPDDDFWKFVKKFESVKKKKGGSSSFASNDENPYQTNELGLPTSFHKHCLLNIDLAVSHREILSYMPPYDLEYEEHPLTEERILEFRKIRQLYLGFKQREKFTRLQKLRESQANLPVAQHRDEIVEAVKSERVVIIAGDTGCGKSTQVPQYLLKAGFNKIACTQPRRIACISLSKRVAYETLNEYGSGVGYQIRFERKRDQHTQIIFITEGLLLRQASSDNALSSYEVIVLDEVHERHLHGDFLLGVIKCLLHQRQDLKLVLMSATINIKLFSDYFGDIARVIQVPGRLHPIKLQYFPLSVEDKSTKSDRFNPGPYIRILQLIDSKYPSEEKGDLLIFLSGFSEIQAVVDAAKEYNIKKKTWIVLALHSSLSLAEQDKVFDYAPDGSRKCIVSTNIAETSVTIDGIRFVADSGKVKEMSYDSTSKMQRLKEFWVSKASAEQRKGRAGRTGPGVCFRLFSEEDYQAMEKYSTPELQRVPLDSLLLQMVSMGLPDSRKFPFIEPPPIENVENTIVSLKQHGAVTADEKLTTLGKMLARLPVDIPLGKMLIMGSLFHQVQPVLSLAAALSVQTPFTNRAFRDPECENSRKSLESDHGDPITLLNAFREWLEEKNNARGQERSATRSWCKRRGLEEQRFYEMTKLRAQFKDLLQDCNLLKEMENMSDKMTSSERAMRHGELKLLRSMRREHQNAAPRKRVLLKVDPFEVCGEGEENTGVDIKDVEFRMRNTTKQVQELLTGSSACSYKDLTMLKVILCSGLYPQFAIADEFNYCKSSAEQLFHTFSKPYVALHPMSFFGHNSKVLQLEEPDIVVAEGFKSKLPLSSKHQLLCYMSLLETTKPYLVNTMRMPAAQTLLLFSHEIHTNSNFSRLVCDSWLQLDFPLSSAAETLLMKAANIHSQWEQLLTLRLDDKDSTLVERKLTDEILHFMRTEVVYTIRRLLAADSKVLYIGPGYNDLTIDPNPFSPEFGAVPNERVGGMQVSGRITYNCLTETDAEALNAEAEASIPWTCEKCEMTCCLPPLERLQHQYQCQTKVTKEGGESCPQEATTSASRKVNSKPYECTECSKTLYLTPIEILKHKKQHT